MNEHPTLTSGWKDASRLDGFVRQISLLLFPKRRLVARFKAVDQKMPSVTFWQEGKECCAVFLFDQTLKENHLYDIFKIFSSMEDEGLIIADSNRIRTTMEIFAPDFEYQFLSKLRFFSWQVRAYEWLLNQEDGKETILVQEVNAASKQILPKSTHVSGVTEFNGDTLEPISSEELSAFVELGIDLRKMRENNV